MKKLALAAATILLLLVGVVPTVADGDPSPKQCPAGRCWEIGIGCVPCK